MLFGMLCRGCGYALNDLPNTICPECGRAFDPGDPTSYAPAIRPPVSKTLVGAAYLLSSWFPVLLVWLYLCYAVARLMIGHWPRISGGDDPKQIPLVNIMVFPIIFGILLGVPFVFAGLGCLGWLATSRPKIAAGVLLAVALSWALGVVLFNWIDVWVWYMD